MSERDTQQSKLYNAERALHLSALNPRLPKVKDVERFLTKLDRATLRRRYGDAVNLKRFPIRVHDGGGYRHAHGGAHEIVIPLWARHGLVVLHEAAHAIHSRLYWPYWQTVKYGTRTLELRGGAAHGWQFAAIFLDLVHFILGKPLADALKAEFKKRRVRFRPKRKSNRVGINPFAERKVA